MEATACHTQHSHVSLLHDAVSVGQGMLQHYFVRALELFLTRQIR